MNQCFNHPTSFVRVTTLPMKSVCSAKRLEMVLEDFLHQIGTDSILQFDVEKNCKPHRRTYRQCFVWFPYTVFETAFNEKGDAGCLKYMLAIVYLQINRDMNNGEQHNGNKIEVELHDKGMWFVSVDGRAISLLYPTKEEAEDAANLLVVSSVLLKLPERPLPETFQPKHLRTPTPGSLE